jgi:hypothetical protein
MAIAPKRFPMFLIDPLTISPEFVLELVDCAPELTDEELGNAGLVMLKGVAELVEDGSELVPDAEAAAGSYKKNEHGNDQRVSLRLTLFVGPADPSTDAALSQKLYAGMFVSAAGSAKQEMLILYRQVYCSDSSSD